MLNGLLELLPHAPTVIFLVAAFFLPGLLVLLPLKPGLPAAIALSPAITLLIFLAGSIVADSLGVPWNAATAALTAAAACPCRVACREEAQLPHTPVARRPRRACETGCWCGRGNRFHGDLPGAAPRNRRPGQSVAGLGSDLPFERADVDPGVRQRHAVGRRSDIRCRSVHVLPRGLAQRSVACPGQYDGSGQPVLDRHRRHDLANWPDVSGLRSPAAASSGLGTDAAVRGLVRQLSFLPAAPQRPVAQRPRHCPGPRHARRRSPACYGT